MARKSHAAITDAEPVMDVRAVTFEPNTGIDKPDRKALADRLGKALSDTYVLYVKTQGFHWNVAGPLFYTLHKLTLAQYEDMFGAIDQLAERIRAIGYPAPASFAQFAARSDIKEEARIPTTEEMVEQLVDGNEICARNLRLAVKVASAAEDVKTADLLTDRIGQHEQNVWMLRAILAK